MGYYNEQGYSDAILRSVASKIHSDLDDSIISSRMQTIRDKIHEVADLIQLADYMQTGIISPETFIGSFDRLYPTDHKEFIND